MYVVAAIDNVVSILPHSHTHQQREQMETEMKHFGRKHRRIIIKMIPWTRNFTAKNTIKSDIVLPENVPLSHSYFVRAHWPETQKELAPACS